MIEIVFAIFAIGVISIAIVSKWAIDKSYELGYKHGKNDGLDIREFKG